MQIEESYRVKPKGCARFMKKGIIYVISILLVLSVLTLPVLVGAQGLSEYRYSGSFFSYMGKVFFQKEYNTFSGEGLYFQASGMGTVEGYHHVHTKLDRDGATTSFIDLFAAGSTFADNSLELAQIERDTIASLEAERTAAIANLNRQLQEGMIPSEYERLMQAVNERYDSLVNQVIREFSDSKQDMRIESKVVANDSSVYAGIQMNPGETGYIKKSAASKNVPGVGEYVRVDSHIKNTGGITAKSTDYSTGGTTFIEENLLVIGYADLWESTRMQKGNVKTGWWDATP